MVAAFEERDALAVSISLSKADVDLTSFKFAEESAAANLDPNLNYASRSPQ